MTQKGINDLAYRIVGCAITVHKQIGPGLLESVYEHCMVEELNYQGFEVVRQVKVPVTYRGKKLDCELRLDLLVNDCVVVELKAVEEIIPLYHAQILTYLKLLDKPKGLIINFNCSNIVSQSISIVTPKFAVLPKE